ncbi:MAG: hypothetical protein V3T49_04385 [Dehalococcoidia bacterium]
MDTNRTSFVSKLAIAIAVALAVLVVAYVIWAFYRVYFSEHARNENSFSWSVAIFVTVIVMSAVAAVSLSRLVIRRISGRRSSSKAIYLLAAPLVILPIPIALVSPTTMIFSFVAMLLLLLNFLFGRSRKSITTTGELLTEAEEL